MLISSSSKYNEQWKWIKEAVWCDKEIGDGGGGDGELRVVDIWTSILINFHSSIKNHCSDSLNFQKSCRFFILMQIEYKQVNIVIIVIFFHVIYNSIAKLTLINPQNCCNFHLSLHIHVIITKPSLSLTASLIPLPYPKIISFEPFPSLIHLNHLSSKIFTYSLS